MATDDGGKRTRFQCLVITRLTAATVVAVLAFAGVAVVLTAGLRPEDISLSVTHGHVQAAQVMWRKVDYLLYHTWRNQPEILTIYKRVNKVDFLVSIHALNPNDRRNTSCYISTVLIFDMPNAPSFTGMVQIAMLNVNYTFPITGHSLDRWIHMEDNATLAYIARTYGGISEFTAMLKVNMIFTSETMRPRNSTQYCWPVTIGHSRSTTAEAVTCKPSHNIDYAAGSVALAPPPPPSPNQPPIKYLLSAAPTVRRYLPTYLLFIINSSIYVLITCRVA